MSDLKSDLDRVLSVLAVAASRPKISLAELAKRTHSEPGEVANDLFGTLSMFGTPPYLPHDYVACTLQHGQVTVRFADNFKRPISLNPLEALSLKLAIESLTPPDEATPKVVVDLLRKIEEGMSQEQRARFNALAKSVVAKAPGVRGPTLRILREAVDGRREVTIEYLGPGKKTAAKRLVRPLGLLSRSGAWYLVAHDVSRARVVSFRLDRIPAAKSTETRFEPPEGFQLEAYARTELFAERGEVAATVRFTGPSARWIREVAEAGTIQQDGEAAIWRAPLGSEESFAAFLLGLGADFVVEKPESLARTVREMLERVSKAHQRPDR
jgi:proteasome accessory factor C